MVKKLECDYLICSEVNGLVNHAVGAFSYRLQDVESLIDLILLHIQVVAVVYEAVALIPSSGTAIVLHC